MSRGFEYRAVWENENGSKRTGDAQSNIDQALNDTLEDAAEFAGDLVAIETRAVEAWRMVPLSKLKEKLK